MRPVSKDGVDTVRSTRQREILDALQAQRQVDVAELAGRFDVSSMTIRRDLADLGEAGLLDRVHGGAVPRRAPAYGARVSARSAEKESIGRAVAALVGPGSAIGVDTGTTCHAVSVELARRDDLTIITNSLHAASELRDSGSRTVVLGGTLTPELSLVGPGAVQETPRIHLDLLVLGCGGLSAKRGITYFDPAEVEVRRVLRGLADRVVIAADHSKFDRKMAMVLDDLGVADVLVTDRAPPEQLGRALAEAGVEVVIAAPERSDPATEPGSI